MSPGKEFGQHLLPRGSRQPGAMSRYVRRIGTGILDSALPDDLTDMSMEALMNIEVTSVSRKPQKQPAAVTGHQRYRYPVGNGHDIPW